MTIWEKLIFLFGNNTLASVQMFSFKKSFIDFLTIDGKILV